MWRGGQVRYGYGCVGQCTYRQKFWIVAHIFRHPYAPFLLRAKGVILGYGGKDRGGRNGGTKSVPRLRDLCRCAFGVGLSDIGSQGSEGKYRAYHSGSSM